MNNLFFTVSRTIIISGLILLIAACSSNPSQEINGETSNSLDESIYQRAKMAYLEQNYKTASTLLEPLAKKGHARAQYTLGYLYYHGTGVKQNLNQAIYWFTEASKQKNTNAIKALEKIKTAMQKSSGVTTQPSQPVIDLRLPKKPDVTQVIKQPDTLVTAPDHPRPAQTIVQPPAPKPVQILQPSPVQPVAKSINPPSAKQSDLIKIKSPKQQESIDWINKQPPNNFTIQLASTTKEAPVIDYISHLQLDGVYYYKANVGGMVRFTVIHGSFLEYDQAKRKLARLQTRGFKHAWIRKLKKVQMQIIAQ